MAEVGEGGGGEGAGFGVGEVGDDLVEGFEIVDGAEVVGQEQGGGVGLLEDVGELVSAVAGIEADDHDAEARGGVLSDEPERTIGQPDRQRAPATESERGQARGKGIHAPPEVRERDPLVSEDDGLAGAVALGHGGQHLVGRRLRERVEARGRDHRRPAVVIITTRTGERITLRRTIIRRARRLAAWS